MRLIRLLKLVILVGIAIMLNACRGRHVLPTISHTEPYPLTVTPSVLPQTTRQNDINSTEIVITIPTSTHAIPRITQTLSLVVTPSSNILPTATLFFLKFIPTDNSIFRFTFEYPSRWSLEYSVDWGNGSGWDYLTLHDKSVPNSRIVLHVLHPNNNDVNERLENILSNTKQNGKLVEDKIIRIDGYEAYWILREMPPESYPDNCLENCTSTGKMEVYVSMKVGEDGYWFELTTPIGNEDSQLMKDFKTMILGMRYIPVK
jgi:hypothetical protein